MSPEQSSYPGDPVHDHVVRRDADRRRIALVALERRHAAPREDELLGDPVELARRRSRPYVLLEQRDRLGDDLSGPGHRLDLGLGLPEDHLASAPTCVRACCISANTSFSVRSPWIGTT